MGLFWKGLIKGKENHLKTSTILAVLGSCLLIFLTIVFVTAKQADSSYNEPGITKDQMIYYENSVMERNMRHQADERYPNAYSAEESVIWDKCLQTLEVEGRRKIQKKYNLTEDQLDQIITDGVVNRWDSVD